MRNRFTDGIPNEREPSPYADENKFCGFDLNELEKQPTVKDGDLIKLPSGTEIVLRPMNPDVVIIRTDNGVTSHWKPPILGYYYNGKWHIGAVDGKLMTGIQPIAVGDMSTVDHKLKASILELTKR